MIKLNTVYKAGKQEVKFQEKEPGLVYAEYGDETVEGKMEGNTLKGIFHNKKVNVTGIMELTFHETGFEGRWKKGIEPGELKQKWNAVLVEDKNPANDSKNGYHIFTDEDNIRYEGEWENDEFISGKAEYVDEDGEKVIEEGEFKDLIITSGKITYENGTIEEGTFDEEGVLHGQGKQTYLDEDGEKVIEEGNFEHSVLKEGKITWADGNCASGVFDEELELNGKGIYTWSNGDFQDGTWVHGEFKDGKAKVTHDDGEISEGMMKDGEWVGEEEEIVNIITNGIENYESGSIYEGDFLNSIRHGIGKYTWANGDYYEGDFVDGDFNGEGIKNYSNGDYKKGIWKDDELIEGVIKKTYESGDIYEGQSLNGIRHGNGRYTWANRDYYEGGFVDGDFNGEGIKNYSNGDYKKGIWKDDEFINGEKKITSEDNEISISFLENSLIKKQIITSKDIWDQEQISTTLFYYENDILTKKEEEDINSKGEINKWTRLYRYNDDKKIIQKEVVWLKENGDKTIYISDYSNDSLVREKTIYSGGILDGRWEEVVFINPTDRNNDFKEVIINYSDGRKFEGTFDFDNFGFHEGKLSYQNGDYEYGEWVEGEDNFEFYTGSIRKTFKSGNIYEGQVKFGKKTGQGIYYNNNDGEYCGEFLNGKLNGWGKLTKPNGEIIEGKWNIGVLTFSFGDLVSLKSGDLNMTIESINGSSAKCIYVYRGKPTSEYYDVSLLKHIKN